MRAVIIALIVLSACGDNLSPPSGPDGGEDIPSPDAEPEIQKMVEGEYLLEWTCLKNCVLDLPAHYYDAVQYRDGILYYWRAGNIEDGVYDTATVDGECVKGNGIPQGSTTPTEPYEFCPDLGGPTATVSWESPSAPGLERVWRVQAILTWEYAR